MTLGATPAFFFALSLLQQVGSALANPIVDLSRDFETSPAVDSSPGSLLLEELVSERPDIREALVLEDGQIVASYTREDIDPMTPTDAMSVTKGLITLSIGTLVDEGLLTVDTTLGKLFPATSLWEDMDDAEYRKSITILELITMTSGLGIERNPNGNDRAMAGHSLREALSNPIILPGMRGQWSYLVVSNILSYVILKLSGMTPREYFAQKILPSLGIDNSEIDWEQNEEGVETGFHGVYLTTLQMAKFGQLYLQGGKSSPKNQVVSQSWVDDTMTPFAEVGYEALNGFRVDIGYILLTMDELWRFQGAGGHNIVLNSDINRIVVTRSEATTSDMDILDRQEDDANTLILAMMDSDVSFEDDKNPSFKGNAVVS